MNIFFALCLMSAWEHLRQISTGFIPDSKVHGANMGSIWGWQDPGGPHELYYLGMVWKAWPQVLFYQVTPVYRGWLYVFVPVRTLPPVVLPPTPGCRFLLIIDYKLKPRNIFPGRHSMRTSQISMFLHIASRVWGHCWYSHTWKQWGITGPLLGKSTLD